MSQVTLRDLIKRFSEDVIAVNRVNLVDQRTHGDQLVVVGLAQTGVGTTD